MKASRRHLRSAVIFCLTLSLSVTGLYPSLMAAAAPLISREVSLPARKCCCGTADGRCCGMACCGMRPPTQDNEQRPATPRDDHQGGGVTLATAGVLGHIQINGEQTCRITAASE